MALFRIFAVATALFLSWAVPTLFRGTSCETAATLVPPSARSSARQATTIAGDGRRVHRITVTSFG